MKNFSSFNQLSCKSCYDRSYINIDKDVLSLPKIDFTIIYSLLHHAIVVCLKIFSKIPFFLIYNRLYHLK